jgi:hypothetical protein
MIKRPFLVRNIPLDGDWSVRAVDILALMAVADGSHNTKRGPQHRGWRPGSGLPGMLVFITCHYGSH